MGITHDKTMVALKYASGCDFGAITGKIFIIVTTQNVSLTLGCADLEP